MLWFLEAQFRTGTLTGPLGCVNYPLIAWSDAVAANWRDGARRTRLGTCLCLFRPWLLPGPCPPRHLLSWKSSGLIADADLVGLQGPEVILSCTTCMSGVCALSIGTMQLATGDSSVYNVYRPKYINPYHFEADMQAYEKYAVCTCIKTHTYICIDI